VIKINEFLQYTEEDQEEDTAARQNNLYAYLTMFLAVIFS